MGLIYGSIQVSVQTNALDCWKSTHSLGLNLHAEYNISCSAFAFHQELKTSYRALLVYRALLACSTVDGEQFLFSFGFAEKSFWNFFVPLFNDAEHQTGNKSKQASISLRA